MSGHAPRALLVLPQLPQDPGSGAARSMTSICELLAESGWLVRALATNVSEALRPDDAQSILETLGIAVERRALRGSELRYRHRGVEFRILVGAKNIRLRDWERAHGRKFDLAFGEELASFKPGVMFTFGMSEGDRRRQRLAVRNGAKVVFGLRNFSYLGFGDWDHVSGILTPSQFMTDTYRAEAGLETTALLAPLEPLEIVSDTRDPIFITLVNPSIAKGVDFFARLAERMSVSRPDIPFLVIESRGTAGTLVDAGSRAGFDLRRHENIMISRAVPLPKDVFAPTRVLVAPSLREPAGRVVGEALLNGVPPIVSDRGGLAELTCGAGRVLSVDGGDAAVTAWMDAIIPLMDDEALYQAESQKARAASVAFDRDVLRPKYDAYFRQVMA